MSTYKASINIPLVFILLCLFSKTPISAQLSVDTVPDPQLMLEQQFGMMLESISNLETKGNSDYWGTYIGTESNIG